MTTPHDWPDLPGSLPPPDLRLPFPSSIHPDVDPVEDELLRWATDLDLLEDEADAQRFSRMKLGLFTGYAYPRTADLALLAKWNTLMWFIDDVIDERQNSGRDETVTRLALGLLAQLPVDMDAPRPTHPLTRAMADLWSAIAPPQSARWRARAADNYRAALACALTTCDDRAHPFTEPFGPATHIRRRREHSGVQMSIDVLDLGREVVPAIADSRMLLAVRGAACDIIGWTNDLWSLPKDHSRKDPVNLVIQLRHARQSTWQQALATATAMTEDAAGDFVTACDDLRQARPFYDVTSAEWDTLQDYLTGLTELTAGMVAWHAKTARYRM
jgi:Terpene synthase family 2, C-terminal metal binding